MLFGCCRPPPPCRRHRLVAADDYPNRPIVARHSAAAGRHQRHHGAGGLRQDERRARPADRGREPQCRRQRHGRHARSRARRARRLHDHSRLHFDARHRPASLPRCRLRSAQGFCADRADRVGAGAAARLQGFAGAQCRRTDRADEELQGAAIRSARRAPALSITSRRCCSRNRPASRSSKSSRKARTR